MEPIGFICDRCRHYWPVAGGCAAFPNGIPNGIIRSNRHTQPRPDQVGKFVFTPLAPQDVLNLLEYATMDKAKADKILKRLRAEDKALVAVYPGMGESVPPGAEYIGGIIDGGLYMIPL